jgi:hypothetical protein
MLKKILVTAAAALMLAACEQPAPATAPPPPPPAPATSFMVFFDWDSSTLNNQSMTVIGQAAAAFKARNASSMTATGHTDTSGPDAYNMALSLRRANMVKDALVQNGVPAGAINAVGVGEQGLLVQTGDGVREPQNRRVEMVVGGGTGMSDAEYCRVLMAKVRTDTRGLDPTGDLGQALSQCQQAQAPYGIAFFIQYLTDNKIPIPPRG